ncbi:MAG: DUF6644 family protein [Bryobacteraceae bacterium]
MKPFFDFFGESTLGEWMRNSRYAFPAFEMVHLLGLGLLLGSILILNARFFGLGMRRQSVSELAYDFAPWTRLALAIMIPSGIALFASKAPDLWNEDRFGFELKLFLVAVAILFHYTVLIPLARSDNYRRGKPAAAFSLLVWFGAAMAGLSLEFL